MFKKYQHVEKLRNVEVEGIMDGMIHVFPKIDGTNASIWLYNDTVRAGSRNRELTIEKDNAGFLAWVLGQENIEAFLIDNPDLRLYGEWLVPHSLKTYKEDAWRNFYVFDVMREDEYIRYADYKDLLDQYGISYIPCLATGENIKEEQLYNFLDHNNFLIQDGKGIGEGLVIKNYDFVNKFGRTTWAKIVTSEFKEKHSRAMGAMKIVSTFDIEERIVNEFCTKALIEKEYAKICNEEDWSSKLIPKLLGVVYYSFVKEESWNIVKHFKNPTINYKLIGRAVNAKIKKELPELF